MKVLSVNAGSSSLKFQMYEMPEEKVLISGVFERIGIDGSLYTIKVNGEKFEKVVPLPDHATAFNILTEELLERGIVKDLTEIEGIGHRIVQGADLYDKSCIIDDKVLKDIEDLSPLAPLHNPAHATGIRAAIEAVPNAVQVAVFDTSFHQTMEPSRFLYAVPYSWYENYKVRRYGFHGTSHKYITEVMKGKLNKEDVNLIICHIGNGASISAIQNGKCRNTSMGFTPVSGIMMSTRCGDIDPSIITYMMDQNMSAASIANALNKESGLLGISGQFSDSRDIEQGIEANNKDCILAQKMFVRRIVDFIAKYYVELNGCDAIVMTAGIGENSRYTRAQIIEQLEILGIHLDPEKNNKIAGYLEQNEGIITTEDSKVPIYVVPTNEEVMIARDTMNLL